MTDDILTKQNFEALMDWLTGATADEPQAAGMFVSKLNEIYITRRLQKDNEGAPRRQRHPGTASRLSLSGIAAEEYLSEIEKGKRAVDGLNVVTSINGKGKAGQEDDLPPADTPLSEREKALALPRTAEGFIDNGINAAILASAVTWIWGETDRELTKGRPASVNLVMLVMYICYGCSLAQRMTRLTDDHPQMWKYGVAFPKAYNKAPAWETGARENAATLEREHPEVTALIREVITKVAEKGISKTADRQRAKGTPWERTYRENKDQWATTIPDTLIAEWFKENLNKNNVF